MCMSILRNWITGADIFCHRLKQVIGETAAMRASKIGIYVTKLLLRVEKTFLLWHNKLYAII